MEVLIPAVNRGAIFRYLLNPLNTNQFFTTVRLGLSQYEVGLENVRLLAQGKSPVLSVDAIVDYHFQTDFLHAGEVKSDGSIDLRKRGDIPFVNEGFLLAERTESVQGSPGMDLSGTIIPVAYPEECIFIANQGSILSEDRLKIYAASDGQPHLDAFGNVSVLAELAIKGNILSSFIAAKKGVKAARIGSETSSPSKIRVGVDDHIKNLLAEQDAKIGETIAILDGLKQKLTEFEEENQTLHLRISESAHIQDRAQLQLEKIEVKVIALKDSRDFKVLGLLSKKIKDLHRAGLRAEDRLENAFQRQDVIVRKVIEKKEEVSLVDEQRKKLVQERFVLVAFNENEDPVARLIVTRKAMPETTIEGPNTTIRLRKSVSRSMIAEVRREEDQGAGQDAAIPFFEMVVSPLAK